MRKLTSLAIGLLACASTPAFAQVDSLVPSTKSYRVYCKGSVGSGFFLSDGTTFITARHVVSNCGPNDTITIKNKLTTIGQLQPTHESTNGDLFIGKVKTSQTVKTYSLNCNTYPAYGTVLYSYGHPQGQATDIAMRSVVRRDPFDIPEHSNDVIVRTAYIPGMSGGPVVDYRGNVVGVVTWVYKKQHNISGFSSIIPVCRHLGN